MYFSSLFWRLSLYDRSIEPLLKEEELIVEVDCIYAIVLFTLPFFPAFSLLLLPSSLLQTLVSENLCFLLTSLKLESSYFLAKSWKNCWYLFPLCQLLSHWFTTFFYLQLFNGSCCFHCQVLLNANIVVVN